MCQTDLDPLDELGLMSIPSVQCVLGDFSSAWNKFTDENLYTGGPSRAEQTDEYAPPESFLDTSSPWLLSPAFDSWSIGIVILELLLGTPNVFSVDQRTKAILTHKLKMQGTSEKEIERALYL
jgi:serine/threonine protein kinase